MMFYQLVREPFDSILRYTHYLIILLSFPDHIVDILNTRLRIMLIIQDLKLLSTKQIIVNSFGYVLNFLRVILMWLIPILPVFLSQCLNMWIVYLKRVQSTSNLIRADNILPTI